MPTISLIATVLNESAAIDRLLDSIGAQTRLPDEVVMADGGSQDDTRRSIETWAARQRFPVRVLVVDGANISQGRNAAIRAARGDVIVSTDAGVRLHAGWLAALAAPFDTPAAQVVGGFFVPDVSNAFEMAMAATVLPVLSDIRPQTFLPSSRSIAFRKSAWEAVGGYPEWLDYCEDLVFDFALRRRYPFAFAPDAIVYFRPRGSLSAFFKQYFRYARGDGKADLWRRRHALRYATYLLGAPALAALALWHSPWWWLAVLMGGLAYTRGPYLRLSAHLPRLSLPGRAYAVALVPIIRLTGDLAKMLGYPAGLWWRFRRKPPR